MDLAEVVGGNKQADGSHVVGQLAGIAKAKAGKPLGEMPDAHVGALYEGGTDAVGSWGACPSPDPDAHAFRQELHDLDDLGMVDP